jgi:hypothetical protein
MVAWSIFAWNKYMSRCTKKCKYTPKMIEMFFNFHEFIVVISHVISHNLN